MDFSLKPHPLVAHWIPGMVVLSLFILSYFNWNYADLTEACAGSGFVTALIVLFLSVAAFVIGEVLDSVRDLLLEDILEGMENPKTENNKNRKKHVMNWYYFAKADKLEQLNDYYWTYYVLNANLFLALLASLVIVVFTWLGNPAGLSLWIRCSLVLGMLTCTVIFFLDAKNLRIYIVNITNGQEESQQQEKEGSTHEKA